MVAGTILLGLLLGRSSAPAAQVDDVTCVALRTAIAVALYDRLPPVDATPEDIAAVGRLNAELTVIRQQIEETC